ncbi:MAG: Hsp20/alpha crystallin family protein [Flavobacteriaceae bacterium]|nr:Hsp20/alpha crystallin family protein [Flavobacteriaceae bacterium]
MLVKKSPFMPHIFDEILKDLAIQTIDPSVNIPAANIVESETDYAIHLAVPGLEKKDFIIDIEEDVLSVSADKKFETEELKGKYNLKEYNFNSFKRTFNLPKDLVEKDKITATYHAGELTILVPKKEVVVYKPKQIEVQ